MLEKEADTMGKVAICLKVALRLTDSMHLGEKNFLDKERNQIVLEDMKYAATMFFETIGELSEKDKFLAVSGFIQTLTFTRYI